MEEGIGGAIVEGGILDVVADDARALLVAAAEEIGAGVMVRVMVGVLISVAVGLRHDDPLRKRPRAMPRQSTAARAHSPSSNAPWKRQLAWLDGQIAELSRGLSQSSRRFGIPRKFQYHVTGLPSTLRCSPVARKSIFRHSGRPEGPSPESITAAAKDGLLRLSPSKQEARHALSWRDKR
jgi:hypothetical protein